MACAPWLPPKTSSVGRAFAGRGGTRKNSLAHRHSGDVAIAEITAGRLKLHDGGLDERPQHTIGKPWNIVRLERDQRHIHDAPGQHRRAGGISANANHYVGTKLAHQLRRLQHRARQVEHRLDPGSQIDAVELTNLHQVQFETSSGHEPGFDPARRAHELHFGAVPRAQLLRQWRGPG